jgi:phenylacetate-coenzyme A ligase PaaK-like adenylate-forming protein
MNIDVFFSRPQFSIPAEEKQQLLFGYLSELNEKHLRQSDDYRELAKKLFSATPQDITELPFLPVSVFKNHTLKSIPDKDVFKVLTSSGTTGSVPSKIYLDTETAQLQTKALSNIMQYVLGKERLPMLIVDTVGLIKNRASFSARGAGVLGMSVFGKSHFYLLDENMKINMDGLKEFVSKHKGTPILIFGFTFMVWQYLFESAPSLDLSGAILIHSGGWKKLIEQQVDNATFKEKLKEKFGITRIYNFYGMVEQVGSVFLECECGFLHSPNFADVIVRSPYDFSVLPNGNEGILQVLSILPGSYPGFSLLTEDVGIIDGEDDCQCGRKGKYFRVQGRMKKAELRGCSDTFTLSN